MQIHIISGFLGAGKTTFLNRYLTILKGKIVVIENDYGDICLDKELIQEDVPVYEMYAGCICCSLITDFQKGIKQISEQFKPDHIVIEPSGVGKLSDVICACQSAKEKEQVDLDISFLVTIVDAEEFECYIEDFGAFYLNQIENAQLILLSNIEKKTEDEIKSIAEELKRENNKAVIYSNDWRLLEDEDLHEIIKLSQQNNESLLRNGEHSHSHTDTGMIFSTLVLDYGAKAGREDLEKILEKLKDRKYGYILRAKGIVNSSGGELVFNFTPEKLDIQGYKKNRTSLITTKKITDKVIIIGCNLNEDGLKNLFLE